MAQQASLQVASRSTKGKGAARTLRREGKVPGVIYGHGREAESVTIDTGARPSTATSRIVVAALMPNSVFVSAAVSMATASASRPCP